MNAACWSASDFLINNSMRQPIKTHRVSRDTTPPKLFGGFRKKFFKPLPWRGLRGLGRRLKPILMKKGLGLMEVLQVSLHYSRPSLGL